MALTDKLTNIGNAIREKTGKSELIPLDNMPDEIRSISGGGGGDTNPTATPKDINFYDYEGTLRYSYTLAEAKALESLPPGPTHPGLTFQEWNWSLEDIKALEYSMNVGATYITDDGKTRLYITIPANAMPDRPPPRNQVPLYIRQTVENGVTIDWGDGSPKETLPGTGTVNTTHTYKKSGDFVITLDPSEGCGLELGSLSSSISVLGSNEKTGLTYCTMLKKVELGKNISYVGYGAFKLCVSLEILTIPNTINSFGKYALYSTSVKCITIPSRLEKIDDYTFSNCNSIAFVFFSNGATSIYNGAFSQCYGITSIMMFANVSDIKSDGFAYCYGLKDVYLLPTNPPKIQSSTFNGVPSDCIYHTRPEALESYKSATNWSVYADQFVGDIVL